MSPTMPYILTSSDDMLIKLWDWEKVRERLVERLPSCMASSIMAHGLRACQQ